MKHFYSWLTCILALATVIFFGCNKESDISPSSIELAESENVKKIKQEFVNRNYELGLHDNLGNNSEIYWEPVWQHAFEQSDNYNVKYIYIPLTSKLKLGQNITTI